MWFFQWIPIPMGSDPNLLMGIFLFWNSKKGNDFFKRKETCIWFAYFQIFLRFSAITYALSNTISLKILTMTLAWINWNLTRKVEIFVKPHFWNFQEKSKTSNSLLRSLIKKVPFNLILITCPIQSNTHVKYFCLSRFWNSRFPNWSDNQCKSFDHMDNKARSKLSSTLECFKNA